MHSVWSRGTRPVGAAGTPHQVGGGYESGEVETRNGLLNTVKLRLGLEHLSPFETSHFLHMHKRKAPTEVCTPMGGVDSAQPASKTLTDSFSVEGQLDMEQEHWVTRKVEWKVSVPLHPLTHSEHAPPLHPTHSP